MFRENPVGVCGDIREMFHQIKIRPCDQNSQRFVWREHPEEDIEHYKMTVMIFGSASSPTTAQYVKNINAQRCPDKSKEAMNAVIQNHYVDDYVKSFSTVEDAIRITNEVIDIHSRGGFEIRNFISNSPEILSSLKESSSNRTICLDMDDRVNKTDKILGLHWNTQIDCFTFKLNFEKVKVDILENRRCPSKREVLSVVMSVFDPFGYLANYTIQAKILLQRIWRSGCEWDETISPNCYSSWIKWFSDLKDVNKIQIPRCYFHKPTCNYKLELHTFVDASEMAYCAVSYLRTIIDGVVYVSFVLGKTKCAPVKYTSIPRLELLAAVLGSRVKSLIVDCHTFKISKFYYWTDSRTVIYWINDEERRYKQYVASRVAEILDNSTAAEWNWISTKDNVADDATRDAFTPPYSNERWLKGPNWLYECYWPNKSIPTKTEECDLELRKEKAIVLLIKNRPHCVIDFSRFSNYLRIKRTFAWVLRFINCARNKNKYKGWLLPSELNSAESKICRLVQQCEFDQDYQTLQVKNQLEKSNSLFKLSPYIDDLGVLRVYGRIDNAPSIPRFTKRPIILPTKHRLTLLIMRYFHESNHHQYDELTICQMRTIFWVNNMRSVLRKVKQQCNRCIIDKANPKVPQMGQHPKDRLAAYVRPFSYTGLDYFGPVMVASGRRREKRWVALFTCLTTRAIHLEVAESLTSDACIMCLKNFCNIRGAPVRIRCDNGTNFVGVAGELNKLSDVWNKEEIQNEISLRNIEWAFNCPMNPASGGCWERLVRSVKRILKDSLKEVAPRVETLRCYLLEACNIINSRPLTKIPLASIDEEPLTPNHFLIGVPNSVQTFGPEEKNLWCLRKQWRIANALKNHFWKRFVLEYIPTITKREKWHSTVEPLKDNELVLICDYHAPRNKWSKGIVESVITSDDGQVRSALVKCNGKVLRRPVSKLAILQIDQDGKSSMSDLRGGSMSKRV